MPRTFWWSWNRAAALAFGLIPAGMAQADSALPHCMAIRPVDIMPAAQDSWPLVARNAFAADGTAGYLSLTLLIPVVRGD